MKIIPFAISAIITAALIFLLNNSWKFGGKSTPLFGEFLSPQHGFWQNAESANEDFNANLKFPQLTGKVNVYLDDRLVPHVFAEKEEDLYFVQGYLHAKFRLFQIDLQTKAAEGRASEIAGARAINYDKEQRRIGMRYAAEKAEIEITKDPEHKKLFDAYTNGINSYIGSLKQSNYPIEYKLLNIKPEKWTNIRTALLLKMMAKMLTYGTDNDLAATNAKAIFMPDELKVLYPQVPDSLEPIIPKGTAFDKPGIIPKKPSNADSLYFNNKGKTVASLVDKPNINNGSNNWAVAGNKTKSGSPILCNDPHLELSLPSIWYEMQLTTPKGSTYGATLPGSPFVIIGFNDSIAWGVTNAQRDVKDYYEIKFKDDSKQEYWYNGKWEKTTLRYEELKIKDAPSIFDTVAYTVYGPVTYDKSFSGMDVNQPANGGKNLAIRWTALDPSNEALTFYKLNIAKNYNEYADAIKTFQCPGQNFVFASKAGDVAIWQQGTFPARWEGQGLYIMPGQDSTFNWQGFIPQSENPHIKNPARGFVTSANQRPVDASYPYFIPGSYITTRGIAITHFLNNMNGITIDDMMKLQNNYFNVTAEDAVPTLLKFVKENELNADEKKYLVIVKHWDLLADADSKGQTVYQTWMDSLQVCVWKDELDRVKPFAPWPDEQTLMELMKKDTASKFFDNINTPQKETLSDDITLALKKAVSNIKEKDAQGLLTWSKFKNPTVYHLLKESLLPFARQGLHVGGSGNIINAVTHSHGPSWRMVVSLTKNTEAYGVYPGGQNGNPGSKFYDDYIDKWVSGKYNTFWMMTKAEEKDIRVKWVMNFSN